MTHISLYRINDWGTICYSISKASSPYGTRSRNEEGILKFMEDQEIEVLWPDGTKVKETVKLKEHYESVSDHGHHNTVTSTIPYFKKEVCGVTIDIEDWSELKFKNEDLVIGKEVER